MIAGLLCWAPEVNTHSKWLNAAKNSEFFQSFPRDSFGYWADKQGVLWQQNRHNQAHTKLEEGPCSFKDDNIYVVAWASLYNRSNLASLLELRQDITSYPDTKLIAFSYLKWGRKCVNYLRGNFVFTIYDKNKGEVISARDHMGIRPYYYHANQSYYLFTSCLGGIKKLIHKQFEPSRKWVVAQIAEVSIDWEETAYEGVFKLKPGHISIVSENQHDVYQYFSVGSLREEPGIGANNSVDFYRQHLDDAITSQLDSEHPLGFELSGGIDSSTIVSFAARYLKNKRFESMRIFGQVTCEKEPKLFHSVMAKYQLPFADLSTTPVPGFSETYHAINIIGYPAEHGSVYSCAPFFDSARFRGVRTLFSGFGGDEFVTNYGRGVAYELAHRHEWAKLYGCMAGNFITKFFRALKFYFHYRIRLQNNDDIVSRSHVKKHKNSVLNDEVIEQYSASPGGHANSMLDQGGHDLNASIIDSYYQSKVPLRLEGGSLIAAASGIEYRWPLLDHKLLKCYFAVPSSEKYYGGISRFLHRRAIRGVAPDMVVDNSRKYVGESYFPIERRGVLDLVEGIVWNRVLKELIDERKYYDLIAMLKHPDISKRTLRYGLRNVLILYRLNVWLEDYV